MEKLRKVLRDPKLAVGFSKIKLKRAAIYAMDVFWSLVSLFSKRGVEPAIRQLSVANCTQVDYFWREYTVIGPELARVKTAYQSKRYLELRFALYPLFRDLVPLYGYHDNEVVLDYGCGPGNDLVGFLVHGKASKVIGMDISEKALNFASQRLAAHKVDPARVELICTSDSNNTLPIDDRSIDLIYCLGVLHHASKPEALLGEFHRVLKAGSPAYIAVHNADSIWFHLYVAYELVILQERFAGMDIYEAFSKTTDTEDCPISRCYIPDEFISLCENAGFNAKYVGGYLSKEELNWLRDYIQSALHDERLGDEHRDFLLNLSFDERGFPKYEGEYAGIGGVYSLEKEPE